MFIALIPTLVAFYRVRQYVQARDQARFDRIVVRSQAEIDQGLVRCVDQLYNMRALFAASDNVGKNQWTTYLSTMNSRHNTLGIRSLGYIEKVTPDTKADFLKRRLADTGTNFAIIPNGERAVYYPGVFITHFDWDAQIIEGLDHGCRPERLRTIEAAIDSNKPLLTESLKLMGADGLHTNSGIFVYLPVYKNGLSIEAPAQRREALKGLIYATIIPQQLFSILYQEPEVNHDQYELAMKVFEGQKGDPANLLYNSEATRQEGATQSHASLSRWFAMSALNRQWTVCFSPTTTFDANSPKYLPWLTLYGGLVMSLLLFRISWVQVNARAQAEHSTTELKRSEAALAAEKEMLGVTLHSIADAVLATDTQGNIISSNPAAERLLGYSENEMQGRPLGEIFRAKREGSHETYPNPVETALRTGETVEPQDHAVLATANGAERIVTSSAAPIRDKTSGIVGAVLVLRDATKSRKSEEEMFKESKLASVGLLAGGIAHDFNNILMVIIGNISLARMASHSTEKVLDRLNSLEQAAVRAKDLTQQLLTFARGGAPIRKPMQLGDLVKGACQFALHGSSVQADFSIPADLWFVEADEGQLRQSINNLVINAVQAMPEGGQIEVKFENVELKDASLPPLRAGKYVTISIRDHGPGISPEHLPHIFEPYFSTKKGSSGLGLATAYSVVRKHDGHIRVESLIGAGTTFYIYLPACLQPPRLAPVHGGTDFFRHGRVLVMDDEPGVLEVAGTMLRACGYEVDTVKDGAEAIEHYLAAKAAGKRFGAVIMDLTVANGMGGRETIKRLKGLDPSVRAIVSSGYSYDPVMANYREYGFSGIIPKPYCMEDLGRVLQEVLTSTETGA